MRDTFRKAPAFWWSAPTTMLLSIPKICFKNFSNKKAPRGLCETLGALWHDFEENSVHNKSPYMLIVIDYIYVSAGTIER